MKKITIIGAGYVGLSLATILDEKYEISILDISKNRVSQINDRIPPIQDELIVKYFSEKNLNFSATTNPKKALTGSDAAIICTPTNYDEENNSFDTSSVEDAIQNVLQYSPSAIIAIKSTIPVGFTQSVCKKHNTNKILFSPEFLRETKALYDNLYPSRIVVGGQTNYAHQIGKVLQSCAKNNPPILYMSSTEAEAVKLFSNTYLALRIAYFNELDTYANANHLDSVNIIKGVCLDPRIGNYYNNPSFGYGGYCLPKDTKQLLANYANVPQNLISAIVQSNQTRKSYISQEIINRKVKTIGVYRLTMKSSSDNFRSSAVIDIIDALKKQVKIIIYEPLLKEQVFRECSVTHDLTDFVSRSDLIIANRTDENTMNFNDKLYTRDLFRRD